MITYELETPAKSGHLFYIPDIGEFNKSRNGIVATIVNPDATSKVFVITQMKGIIKYPAEDGTLRCLKHY